jgi:hypothetical protein
VCTRVASLVVPIEVVPLGGSREWQLSEGVQIRSDTMWVNRTLWWMWPRQGAAGLPQGARPIRSSPLRDWSNIPGTLHPECCGSHGQTLRHSDCCLHQLQEIAVLHGDLHASQWILIQLCMTDLLTYLWSWALLEEPLIEQPLENFPAFHGTLDWSLSWALSTQSTPSHPISLWFILILSTHLQEPG